MVTTQQIPQTHWPEYLHDLADRFRGWHATVEVQMPEIGDQTAVDHLPLLGLEIEPAGTRRGDLLIEAGDNADRLALHYVVRPVSIQTATTDGGGETDLHIQSEDGTVTLLRLFPPRALPDGPASSPAAENRMQDRTRPQGAAWPPEGQPTGQPRARIWDTTTPASSPQAGNAAPISPAPAPAPRAEPRQPLARDHNRAAVQPRQDQYEERAQQEQAQRQPVATSWWAYALRGVAAIAFGVMAMALPGLALLSLVLLFGVYAIADGVLDLADAVSPARRRLSRPRWVAVIMAIISFAAGAFALTMPGLTAITLLFIIGAWAAATGVMEIIAAATLSGRGASSRLLLGLAGAVSLAFGVLVMGYPGSGALAMVLWIGAFAIVFGVLLIAEGIRAWRARAAASSAAPPAYT